MREFAVTFHRDLTFEDIDLNQLPKNRIDSLARIISAAFFLSHKFRRDVILYLIFPSFVLRIEGERARHIHPDERSIAGLLKRFLKTKRHRGFSILNLKELNLRDFVVLEENGGDLGVDCRKFLLGDYLGFPDFIKLHISKNKRISLGKKSYLTSHCIVVIHHELDRVEEKAL
ncbi:MAG: hypothetical protein ACE5K0_09490 [Candidatus Methanofastidiosia archaeon]